jgi:hypothetical protein
MSERRLSTIVEPAYRQYVIKHFSTDDRVDEEQSEALATI